MKSIDKLLLEIEKWIKEIKSKRPLNSTELKELQKSLWIMFTYHSNAIEWNSISLWETKMILEDWITIWWKTIRELQETLNHKDLLIFLNKFISENQEIDEKLIKYIHSLVMKNIDENAWEYRKIQVYITWEEILPPKANLIPKLMTELLNKYDFSDYKNIALKVAEFHYDFVKIHPFIDWNWRTIRLIINMILMKHWFPMIIIPVIRRLDYIGNLNSLKSKNDFVQVLLDIINENIKDYLRMIEV